MQTHLNRIYMETTPVAQILEQHQKLGSNDFTKWLIGSEKKLLKKGVDYSKTVLSILEQHQKLNSFDFTKWIISKSNQLLKSESIENEAQSNS